MGQWSITLSRIYSQRYWHPRGSSTACHVKQNVNDVTGALRTIRWEEWCNWNCSTGSTGCIPWHYWEEDWGSLKRQKLSACIVQNQSSRRAWSSAQHRHNNGKALSRIPSHCISVLQGIFLHSGLAFLIWPTKPVGVPVHFRHFPHFSNEIPHQTCTLKWCDGNRFDSVLRKY